MIGENTIVRGSAYYDVHNFLTNKTNICNPNNNEKI